MSFLFLFILRILLISLLCVTCPVLRSLSPLLLLLPPMLLPLHDLIMSVGGTNVGLCLSFIIVLTLLGHNISTSALVLFFYFLFNFIIRFYKIIIIIINGLFGYFTSTIIKWISFFCNSL